MKFSEDKTSETIFQVGWLQKLSYNSFCEKEVIHCEVKDRGEGTKCPNMELTKKTYKQRELVPVARLKLYSM